MNEHTNPTKRLTKVLRKGRAKAFGSGEAFYAAFEQAIARTKEDIDTLYIRKDEAVKQIEELRERLGVALDRALCLELDVDDYVTEIAALKIELAYERAQNHRQVRREDKGAAMIDPKYRFLLHDEAIVNRDKRIKELEQLLLDLWVYAMRPHHGGVDGESLFYRMQDLGLLEGEHHERKI